MHVELIERGKHHSKRLDESEFRLDRAIEFPVKNSGGDSHTCLRGNSTILKR